MHMKLYVTILFVTIVLMGCKRSEEEILTSAEKTVLRFVDEVKLQNFKSAEETYPALAEFSSYRILKEFKINRSEIVDDIVKVFAEYKSPAGNDMHPIQFTLREEELDRWMIINSKGLSPYIYQDVFTIAKRSGCITNIESDVQIEKDCMFLEKNIEKRVQEIKEHIEANVDFVMRGSNLSKSYGYISGEVTVMNTSGLSIPSYSYDLYVTFFNSQGDLIHAEKVTAFGGLSQNELKQFSFFSSNISRQYDKYSTLLRITDTDFIKRYIIQNEVISCN